MFVSMASEAPESYLSAVGTVFARFDRQDSGNLSYGVEVAGSRYFVKTAGRPEDATSFLGHEARVELLHNAARLARAYPHPALPRLHQIVESAHGPMLVYEWVDGELLGDRRDDPAGAFQRFRALPAARIIACLDTIVQVHELLGRGGEVAGDFYDGCLIYDFATHRLSVVDLDGYRPAPYRNEMGRMFGSSRFMAPEEFVHGEVIDQRTSVFTLGRTALVLLSDGTADRQRFRGDSALYEVATRACRPEPARRYASLAEFCAAWQAARALAGGA